MEQMGPPDLKKRKPRKDIMDQQGAAEELSERLIFPASKTLVEAIADYRFSRRIDSKADAIRRLIEAGLKAENEKAKGQ